MLHFRKWHLYPKGIALPYKPSQLLTLHPSLSITTKTTKPLKDIKLSDEPPTPWPPINPKLEDYEAQKGPQRHTADKDSYRSINVGALFLFAGALCGAIISIYQPKDFRNDFKFYSPLPDAKYSTLERTEPLNFDQTLQIKNDIQQDQASAMSFSLCLGFAGGVIGKLWYRTWTHPLRIKQHSLFELTEALSELRTHSFRNALKGTLFGSCGVLGFIYASVFFGYLYLGQVYANKYADRTFWKYMELTYQKNIESRRSYEIDLEVQDHLKQKQVMNARAPVTPSITGDKEVSELKGKKEDEEKVVEEEQKRKRELYKKTVKGMEWNTDLYLKTTHLPYHKLTEEEKAVRWNMAREMATLAMSCALYIVIPVYFGTSMFATRAYSKYWRRVSHEMIKTKQMPKFVF